jgi:hypothetical protein
VRLLKTGLLVAVFALAFLALAFHAPGAGAREPRARKPNLSGKWVMDAARSDFGGYAGPQSKASTRLEIRHKEPEFVTIWDFKYGANGLALYRKFFTDGRGETSASLSDADEDLGRPAPVDAGGPGRQVRSKTEWDGTKLVTRTQDRLLASGAAVEVEVLDVWELSSDKKTLTQTHEVTPKRAGEGGALKFRRVYDRAR